jgi:hypothetical protein
MKTWMQGIINKVFISMIVMSTYLDHRIHAHRQDWVNIMAMRHRHWTREHKVLSVPARETAMTSCPVESTQDSGLIGGPTRSSNRPLKLFKGLQLEFHRALLHVPTMLAKALVHVQALHKCSSSLLWALACRVSFYKKFWIRAPLPSHIEEILTLIVNLN